MGFGWPSWLKLDEISRLTVGSMVDISRAKDITPWGTAVGDFFFCIPSLYRCGPEMNSRLEIYYLRKNYNRDDFNG
jgi:hypothetical protein